MPDVHLSSASYTQVPVRATETERRWFGLLIQRGLIRVNDAGVQVDASLVQLAPRHLQSRQRPWTAAEDDLMRDRIQAGESICAVSHQLGRSQSGVSARMRELQITKPPPLRRVAMVIPREPQLALQPRPISDRDQALMQATRAEEPTRTVAARLGISYWGAVGILRRHGLEPVPSGVARLKLIAAIRAALPEVDSTEALCARIGPSVTRARVVALVRQIDPRWAQRCLVRERRRRRERRRAGIARLRLALACRRLPAVWALRAAGCRMQQPLSVFTNGCSDALMEALAVVLTVPAGWLIHGTGPQPAGVSARRARAWKTHPERHCTPEQRARYARCRAAIRAWVPRGHTLRQVAERLQESSHVVRRLAGELGIRSSYHTHRVDPPLARSHRSISRQRQARTA